MRTRTISSFVAASLTMAALSQVVVGRPLRLGQSAAPARSEPAARGRANAPTPVNTVPDRRAKVAAAATRIDEIVRRRQQEWHLPGVFYGVLVDGELVTSGSVGVRDLASGAPVTPDTVFRIASMTKSFTTLAILKLRDAGKLGLDDPIQKYVPEAAGWTYPTRDSAPITVRQLLNHAEGFPEDNPWGDRQLAIPGEQMAAWLREGIPFSNVPGVAYEYSNYGFAILGRIVSLVSGQPYSQFMDREILQPLGLASSFWDTSSVPADRLAHGYRWQDERWQAESPLPDGSFGPMGGLYTSGHDLARYVAFHMGAWPPRDDPEREPVRRSSVREMQQGWRFASFAVDRPAPGAPVTGNTRSYAYGLAAVRDCQLGYTVGHGGGLPGYGSHMIWLPDVGVGVIAMANVTYAPGSVLTRDILDILRDAGALVPRAVQPSTAVLVSIAAIMRMLDDWKDEDAARVVADNLFLDRSAERRKADIARLHEQVGRCAATSRLEPENWLRAQFRADCERGWVDVTFTLAPTSPPRIQSLQFQTGRPMSDRMKAMADLVAAAAADGTGARLQTLTASAADRKILSAQLESIRVNYGTCRAADVLSGDGDANVRVRYQCDRGRFDADLQRDVSSNRLRTLRLSRSPGDMCVS